MQRPNEDFPAIEAEMKQEIKPNNVFEKIVVSREQAFQDAQSGRLGALTERAIASKFKLGNLEDIPEGEAISYYRNGGFLDLYAGLVKDAYKATEWKKYRVTRHTHNPVDDARGNAEALKRFRELGLRI